LVPVEVLNGDDAFDVRLNRNIIGLSVEIRTAISLMPGASPIERNPL
jgi:hypothetical protein